MLTLNSGRVAALALLALGALGGCVTPSSNGSGPAAPEIGLTDARFDLESDPNESGQPVRAGRYDVPRGIYGLEGRDQVLVRSADMDAYLRGMLSRLAQPITSADYTGDVGIFLTSAPNFSAVATPSNEILISLGALDRIGSEEQLAFLVAHELSHVVRQDLERTEALAGQDQVATRILQLTSLETDLAGRFRTVVEGDPEEARKILRLRRQIAIAVHSLQLVLENNVGPAWTRGQERIADKAAADLMYKAGYNPLNASAVFGLLGEAEAQRKAEVDRHIKELTRLTGELVAAREDDPTVGRLKGAGVTVGAEIMGGLIDAFSATPYDAAHDRREAFEAYVGERYGLSEPGLGRTAALKRLRDGGGAYAALRQRIERAREAEEQFNAAYQRASGDPDRASGIEASLRTATEAVSGPGREAGLPRLVFHRIHKTMGDDHRALDNLDRVVGRPQLGPAPRIVTARYLASRGGHDRALDVVDQLASSYGAEPIYPLAYDVNDTLGDTVEAQRILQACLNEASQRRTRLACRAREQDLKARGRDHDSGSFMQKLVGGSDQTAVDTHGSKGDAGGGNGAGAAKSFRDGLNALFE